MEVVVISAVVLALNLLALVVVALNMRPSPSASEVAFGYVSGVMISVSFLSLLGNAINQGSLIAVLAGLSVGVVTLWLIDHALPHVHPGGFSETPGARGARRSWLIALAMGIHNIPEGLATGVALAYNIALGVSTGLAIGLHDFVETSTLAASLVLAGIRRRIVAYVVIAASIIEVAGIAPGYLLPSAIPWTLPLLLAAAAGGMIYVVVDELIPDVMREASEYRGVAFVGFIAGVFTVVVLEKALAGL